MRAVPRLEQHLSSLISGRMRVGIGEADRPLATPRQSQSVRQDRLTRVGYASSKVSPVSRQAIRPRTVFESRIDTFR